MAKFMYEVLVWNYDNAVKHTIVSITNILGGEDTTS